MAYIGKSPDGTGVRSRFYYTQSSGGGTSVTGSSDDGTSLAFSDGAYVDVFLNGVLLVAGTDYNTTTANTIAGLAAMANGDVVEVVVYDIFTVADTVSSLNGGTFSDNVNFIGNIDVDGTTTVDGLTSSEALDVTTSTHANASVFKSTGNTQIMLQDTDATANDQYWGLQVSGGDFNVLTCNDDRASGFVTPLTIDSSGRITKPTQPAFMAQPSSTQSNLAGDTNVDVLMGTEGYDVGSNFSSSTFTAPVTGKYFLSFTLYGNQLAGSANYMEMSIDTSNRNYTIIQEPSGSESVYAGGTVAVIADMDANDTAKCRITVGGSSTFDVTVSSRFTGALIC